MSCTPHVMDRGCLACGDCAMLVPPSREPNHRIPQPSATWWQCPTRSNQELTCVASGLGGRGPRAGVALEARRLPSRNTRVTAGSVRWPAPHEDALPVQVVARSSCPAYCVVLPKTSSPSCSRRVVARASWLLAGASERRSGARGSAEVTLDPRERQFELPA